MILADALTTDEVIRIAAASVGVLATGLAAIVNHQIKKSDKAEAAKEKVVSDAVASKKAADEKALVDHHEHDNERFAALDSRLTGLAEARRKGDAEIHAQIVELASGMNEKIAALSTELARLDERLAAFRKRS